MELVQKCWIYEYWIDSYNGIPVMLRKNTLTEQICFNAQSVLNCYERDLGVRLTTDDQKLDVINMWKKQHPENDMYGVQELFNKG